ncbi:MAG TPA: MerR family transcriptional regulator [Candidatus Obscuribacterales bacterium]
MQYFTRRETVILTRTSPGRLAYLARTGVIMPDRRADDGSGQVYYSWEQILELRAIRHLRRQVSLQMIRKILTFLDGVGSDRTLRNKHLVITNGEVTWVQTGDDLPLQGVQVAAKADRHVGQLQLMTLPPLVALADEIWETARRSQVIDFESFRQRVVPLRPE